MNNTDESKSARPCAVDGHVFMWSNVTYFVIGEDGLWRDVRKRRLVCKHCGVMCDSVGEAIRLGGIVEFEQGDKTFPSEKRESMMAEYSKYIKPKFWNSGIVATTVLSILCFVSGMAGLVMGGSLTNALLAAIGIGLGYFLVHIYVTDRKKFRCSTTGLRALMYATDFSESKSFFKDDFRIGNGCLYIRHGSEPVKYGDIAELYVRETTKIPKFRILMINLKNGSGCRELSYLEKGTQWSASEIIMLAEVIKALREQNYRIQIRARGIPLESIVLSKPAQADEGKERIPGRRVRVSCDGSINTYPLTERQIFGRRSEDFPVTDKTVSREHGEFVT